MTQKKHVVLIAILLLSITFSMLSNSALEAYRAAFSCDLVTEIPQAECEALVAFYNGTNGPSWYVNTGWLATNSPCSWHGVQCDGGHVTWLVLDNNGLSGSLPNELANLSQLGVLWLWSNQIGGDIHMLPALTNLDTLDLRENQLSGVIPPEMGNLNNLKGLFLPDNRLVGSVPPSLGNLTQLVQLDLARNQLTGNIPPELGNLSRLIELHLYENQLSGSIPNSLGHLNALTSLILGHNQLSGRIPRELGNLAHLEWLILPDNQLSGPIPPEICNLRNLTRLLLAYNQLHGAIPAEIGNLSLLQEFTLDNNALRGEIPVSITNLQDAELTIHQNACLTSSNSQVIAFLNQKDPLWQETQYRCPPGRQ